MKIAKVIGQVITTQNEGNISGKKLLVVRYLNEKLQDTQKTIACIDSVNANAGDIVLLCSSSSARLTKITSNVCTDNTIVGIIETISSKKKNWYMRESKD
jgi:microcompartment protein CcmK/EutM